MSNCTVARLSLRKIYAGAFREVENRRRQAPEASSRFFRSAFNTGGTERPQRRIDDFETAAD